MNRRTFLQCGLAGVIAAPLWAETNDDTFGQATQILNKFVDSGQIKWGAICALTGRDSASQLDAYSHFAGQGHSLDSLFLLGSISKPICITALMTLFDKGEFKLDDRLQRFIPEFNGDGKEAVTMRHLMTHCSGLPDQLADNAQLRKRHAPLSQFVEHAIRTPLQFAAGTQYQYSSMGVLLATHVAEIIAQQDICKFVAETVFKPLAMSRSAQGMGDFPRSAIVPVQMEFAAPEAGAGDPAAKDWDWNSDYWRGLGAPWGGTQCSAGDVGRFMQEFLLKRGTLLKPETEAMMVIPQSPAGLTPRGLGFNVGSIAASTGCSEKSFGHTGSTGTLAWADPSTNTVCVVLTSLPGRAMTPHPRELVGAAIGKASRRS